MKDLKYYMNLNYNIVIYKYSEEEGGGFRASIPQLGDAAFVADGDTIDEAVTNLDIVKKEIFSHWLENGVKIEEPKNESDVEYSGKFIVRVPVELHRQLAQTAENQKISLNSYLNYLLSSKLSIDMVCSKMKSQISESFKETLESHSFDGLLHDVKNLKLYSDKNQYTVAS